MNITNEHVFVLGILSEAQDCNDGNLKSSERELQLCKEAAAETR